MDAFVLDASTAISWCFPKDSTENTPYSQAILTRLEEADAIVPEIWPFEVANSIFVSFNRRKRIGEDEIKTYIGLIMSLPIRVDRRSWTEILSLEPLARKHDLAVYDVAYLELAKRLKLTLATTDANLRRAAHAESVKLTPASLKDVSTDSWKWRGHTKPHRSSYGEGEPAAIPIGVCRAAWRGTPVRE
jgi:predicted nucleic acid-binding protein